jgi:hypothetical protein
MQALGGLVALGALEVLRRRRAGTPVLGRLSGSFSEMLSNTSTHWAPWHVVPADRQWFARLAAAAAIANTLITIAPRYPVLDEDVRQDLLAARAELEAEGPKAKGAKSPGSGGRFTPGG